MPRDKRSEADWSELPGEPEGWRELQERARNERDPRKLEAIIAEMNRLLNECEKKAAALEAPPAQPKISRKLSSIPNSGL
jgi:hypothetical protein